MKKALTLSIFLMVINLMTAPSAHANLGLIARGFAKTVYAVAQVPANMMQGSAQSFPLGLVTGAIAGTVKMTAGTVMGAFDMARGAAPYAKYLVFM